MVINMCEYNNVPKIRFKGFTDVWEQRKLDRLLEQYTEVTTINNQYPALTSSRKGIFFQTEYFAGNQIASQNNVGYNIVPRNYFTYRHMSDDEIFHFNINEICDFGIVSTLYPVFTTKKALDSKYLQYQLNYGIEFAKIASLQKQGGSRTYMYFAKLKDLVLTMPKTEEQKKISSILSNIDNLITLHQRKFNDILVYKLRKKILFLKFTKNVWEQRKLEDITQIVMGQSPDSINYTDNSDDTVLIQGNADLNNGIVVPRIWSSQITKKSYPNDIIFTVRAPVGEIARNPYFATIGRGVASFKGNDFLYQSLIQKKENNYWNNISAGSTFDSINSDQLKNVIIYLPKNNLEQEKIGELFTNLDNLITLHQRKLEKLKNIKKSMLEKMFV